MAGNLPRVGVELTADGSDKFLRAIGDGDRAVTQFGQAAMGAAPSFTSLSTIATGAFLEIGARLVDLTADVGRFVAGFAGEAVTLASDFESTLNSFASVTGPLDQTGLTLEDFQAKFLELGAATKYSAQEAAEAGVELAKAGLPIESIMGDATDATLALAAAGELELAPAAEIVGKQLGVWADTGVTATDTANLLAQAANASTMDVDELALGLANVGGVAKIAGLTFNETVQTMALISPSFSSAADSGTALKTTLARLTPQTKDAAGMMESLGLYTQETGSVFYDATGSFVGMEEASELLYQATKDLSQEQRKVAFEVIFGSDAIRAAAAIAEAGATGYNAMGDAMGSTGTVFDQAAKKNEGYKASLEAMHGSFENLQIVIGQKVLPTLTPFVKLVTDGINVVYAFADGSGDMGAALDTLGDNLTTMSPTLGKYFAILTSGRGVFDGLAAIAGDLLANLGPIGTTAQNLINIFVRGQDTLANWEFLERSTAALKEQLLTTGEAVLAFAGETAVNLVAAVPQIRQAMLDWALAAAGWAIEAAPMLLDGLAGLLQTAVSWAAAAALTWGEQMLAFAQKAVEWIAPMLPGLGDALGQFLNTMINWVVSSLPAWVAQLQQLGMAAVKWVQDALPGLGTNLGQFAGKLLAWIIQTAADVVPKLAELGVKFVAWVVTDVLPELPGVLFKIGEAIGNFIWETGVAIGPGLLELAEKFIAWVPDVVLVKLPDLLGRVWENISTWIGDIAGKALEAAKQIGRDLIGGITAGVEAAAHELYEATVGAVWDAITGSQNAIDSHSPSRVTFDLIGRPMIDGVRMGVLDGAAALEQTMVDSLGAAIEAGSASMAAGAAEIATSFGATLAAEFAKPMAGPNLAAMFDAGRALRDQISPMAGIGSGPRIQPPATPGQVFGNTYNNQVSHQISYNPTYHTPAPPPAMSYAALQAMASV